jgi:hypothetical protein
MIVPMSGHSTERMENLIHLYKSVRQKWIFNISADANPSVLFPGVKFRLAIVLLCDKSDFPPLTATTGYTKFYAEERSNLFDTKVRYCLHKTQTWSVIPKYADSEMMGIIEKIGHKKGTLYSNNGEKTVLYHNTPVSWIRSHRSVPFFTSERDGEKASTQLKTLKFKNEQQAAFAHCIIASSIFFMWYVSQSDCYHLNKSEIVNFPVDFNSSTEYAHFVDLSAEYEKDQNNKAVRRVYVYQTSGRVEYDEFYPKLSKNLIDTIDKELGHYYGFTAEETDYVKNFAIKYRMGLVGADATSSDEDMA